jgi:hypothetical protein
MLQVAPRERKLQLPWGQGATMLELALGTLGNCRGAAAQGPLYPHLIQTGGDESAMNPAAISRVLLLPGAYFRQLLDHPKTKVAQRGGPQCEPPLERLP